MKKYQFSITVLLAGLMITSCKPKIESEVVVAGDVDATRFVVIGGTDMAGMMDDALYADGQNNSLATLLSQQLELIGGTAIHQNLMPASSNGFSAQGNSKLILGYKTDCLNVTSLSPIRATVSGDVASFMTNGNSASTPYTNFGIPFMSVGYYTIPGYGNPAAGPGNYNPFFTRIASNPSTASVKGDIMATNPTFFAYSPGLDEVMLYAAGGAKSGGLILANGPVGPAPVGGFDGNINDLLTSLTANGAKGVISNIPDVTDFPFFNTIPYNGLVLDAANAATLNSIYNQIGITFQVGANPFLIEDPTAGAFGIRQMVAGEKLLLSVPLDSVKCYKMGSIFPFRDEFVLEISELNEIRTAISNYNAVISNSSANYNLALVDAYSFYKTLKSGIVYNGIAMSTTFVSGGSFSLDGRSLTARGNALLANKYIQAINSKYNSKIWEVNATAYGGVKFP